MKSVYPEIISVKWELNLYFWVVLANYSFRKLFNGLELATRAVW